MRFLKWKKKDLKQPAKVFWPLERRETKKGVQKTSLTQAGATKSGYTPVTQI